MASQYFDLLFSYQNLHGCFIFSHAITITAIVGLSKSFSKPVTMRGFLQEKPMISFKGAHFPKDVIRFCRQYLQSPSGINLRTKLSC